MASYKHMQVSYISSEHSRVKIADGPPKALIAESLTRDTDRDLEDRVTVKIALPSPWPSTARATMFLEINSALRQDDGDTWYLLGSISSPDLGRSGPFEASYSSKHRSGWIAYLEPHQYMMPFAHSSDD